MFSLDSQSFTLLALSALLFGQKVLADNLFVGCYADDETTFVNEVGGEGDPATVAACSTSCSTSEYAYAAWRASDSSCFCSNDFPKGPQMSTGNGGHCTTSSNFDVRVTSTSFMLSQCVDSVTYNNDGFNPFVVVNPKDCFRNCNGAYIGTYIENPQNGYYTCHCAANGLSDSGTEMTCGPTSYFIFYHTEAAKASGLTRRAAPSGVRRSLDDTEEIISRTHKQHCPLGLTACLVQSQDESYECLDTSTELESCGGCMYGQYGNTTAIAGQDCTNIGAALGASTCVQGQCIASSCRTGWKLVDGKCQKTTNRRALQSRSKYIRKARAT
ncbi:uncharacterized protein I303_105048 [Kwoniella dejecticola CBS 10117]|uniref:Protein CPL1-like domain-containing protein n=1 Tax=Kwoniella dejecticola CBS 10117 TaxID=1296121 RepID=A0A1A6A3L1_9TREE|nr:uncharacterized protein I303_05506 [Kwoniella dejecticola CBS 10117]OBR84647.1 hypothetical protein I303_05506 [Kwoniella dejecticola CBS 10117]